MFLHIRIVRSRPSASDSADRFSYSEVSAQWTYRVSFGIMAAMTLWLGTFASFLCLDLRSITTTQRSSTNPHSLLPILQSRLLVNRPSPIQEEQPRKPVRLRHQVPQARCYPFRRSSDRYHLRMVLQRFLILRKQAIRIQFHLGDFTWIKGKCDDHLVMESGQHLRLARWVLLGGVLD